MVNYFCKKFFYSHNTSVTNGQMDDNHANSLTVI